MTNRFFTIFQTYFKCCTERTGCCCCHKDVTNENSRYNENNIGNGDTSPFSFDDLTSTTNDSGSTSTWSSSSSLEDYKIQHIRPKFKPFIGIIPANYYRD